MLSTQTYYAYITFERKEITNFASFITAIMTKKKTPRNHSKGHAEEDRAGDSTKDKIFSKSQ